MKNLCSNALSDNAVGVFVYQKLDKMLPVVKP